MLYPHKKSGPGGPQPRLPARDLLEDLDADADDDDRAENGQRNRQNSGDRVSRVPCHGRKGGGQSGNSAGSTGLRKPLLSSDNLYE